MKYKKAIFYFKVKHLLKKIVLLNKLKKIDDLPFDDLKKNNFYKRKRIVVYAYENIPFYKNFYDLHNFHPRKIISENDWNKIPILTKQILKANTEKIKNPNLVQSRFKSSTTGGSTGMPLKVFFDNKVPLESFGWRTLRWWGIEPWENQAYIYRNVRGGIGQLFNNLMWWPTKRTLLDCSSMSNSDMDIFAKSINRIKPAFIQGYVGGVFDFAKYVFENDIKVHIPKAIWVTAAPLSESTRKFIEDVFQAPVYDQYGCSEMFWLAAECKMQEGLHFLADIRHIEFLDEKDNVVETEQFGDVTITDLENEVFPIIRYKNGDRGRYLKKQCTCGLPYPLIDKIKGRVTDNIKSPSGISVNGAYLTTIFDEFPELVDGFQIIQHEDFSIEINCALAEGISSDDHNFKKIKNQLELKTNNELLVSFNFTRGLIQDGGKLKFVISKLN